MNRNRNEERTPHASDQEFVESCWSSFIVCVVFVFMCVCAYVCLCLCVRTYGEYIASLSSTTY